MAGGPGIETTSRRERKGKKTGKGTPGQGFGSNCAG